MKVLLKNSYGPRSLNKNFCKEFNIEYTNSVSDNCCIPTKWTEELEELCINQVESRGSDYVAGSYCHFTIVDIPKGRKYRILDYDGYEYIEYADDIIWKIAK